MKGLVVGFIGIAVIAVSVTVGTLFFEGLSSSNTITQWTLPIAGFTIIPATALAGIAWVFAYPR